MKKSFTLALSIIICNTMMAAGEFFLKINSNGNYTVSLNNQTISSSTNTFRFFDLYSGNQTLKVIENGINGRVIFEKPVTISNNYRTIAELDRFSGLSILENIPYTQSVWYIDHLQVNPNNQNGWNNPSTYGPKPRPRCGTNWNHTCNANCNTNWNNNWNNGNTGWNPYSTFPNNFPNGNFGFGNLLQDTDLQSLLQTMKNIPFEDKRIELAKSALKTRAIKTNQVEQLLQQFTFEQNKLELAKYCYDKTIDQNNYYTLYDDFTFSNYSSQLAKYIDSK